ncbi:hypothetical protein [Microbacterium sp. NPDC055665]
MTDTYYPGPSDEDAPPADVWGHDDPAVDPSTGEVGGESESVGVEKMLFDLHTALTAQGEALEEHEKQLDGLRELLNATPDGPWNWAMLPPDARAKLWHRLYEWVGWLESRYLQYLSPAKNGIPELVADWYRHPIAVELLTSLMVAHAAAYRKKASIPSFALVEWHERCLWPTLARMDALGLFKSVVPNVPWDGPTEREMPHDDDRFTAWVADDTKPVEKN